MQNELLGLVNINETKIADNATAVAQATTTLTALIESIISIIC